MTDCPKQLRIALIGAGTIGAELLRNIPSLPGAELVAVLTRSATARSDGLANVQTVAALLALQPDVVVECAGADAFAAHVPAVLAAGVDVIAVSAAAMARKDVESAISGLQGPHVGTLYFASGAIGALDALSAAREGGLTRVDVIQRKPPAALLGPAEAGGLQEAKLIKSSSAREVALEFPQNSNVAAAAAIAGLGFDETRVTVIADPAVSTNSVELVAEGRFGNFRLVIENQPSPTNPKTSMTPAMSVLAALRRRSARIRIPA